MRQSRGELASLSAAEDMYCSVRTRSGGSARVASPCRACVDKGPLSLPLLGDAVSRRRTETAVLVPYPRLIWFSPRWSIISSLYALLWRNAHPCTSGRALNGGGRDEREEDQRASARASLAQSAIAHAKRGICHREGAARAATPDARSPGALDPPRACSGTSAAHAHNISPTGEQRR